MLIYIRFKNQSKYEMLDSLLLENHSIFEFFSYKVRANECLELVYTDVDKLFNVHANVRYDILSTL